MRRIGDWVGLRDGLLMVIAAAIGLAIGYADSRPTWDDTGITVALLLLSSAIAAGLSGRRPWIWALLVGLGVPLFELRGAGGAVSLVALLITTAGSLAGYAVVRAAEGAA